MKKSVNYLHFQSFTETSGIMPPISPSDGQNQKNMLHWKKHIFFAEQLIDVLAYCDVLV